mmetsp:Transcript_25285/g.72802  ORF Transcript_25285/g.72802 Transcript_25285/m.72802 type:complete len:250 (+) Transcript_25285:142-891(+)
MAADSQRAPRPGLRRGRCPPCGPMTVHTRECPSRAGFSRRSGACTEAMRTTWATTCEAAATPASAATQASILAVFPASILAIAATTLASAATWRPRFRPLATPAATTPTAPAAWVAAPMAPGTRPTWSAAPAWSAATPWAPASAATSASPAATSTGSRRPVRMPPSAATTRATSGALAAAAALVVPRCHRLAAWRASLHRLRAGARREWAAPTAAHGASAARAAPELRPSAATARAAAAARPAAARATR